MKNKINIIPFICLVISHIMCIHVTWKWCEHANNVSYSMPPWVNIVIAIPYLVMILILLLIKPL